MPFHSAIYKLKLNERAHLISFQIFPSYVFFWFNNVVHVSPIEHYYKAQLNMVEYTLLYISYLYLQRPFRESIAIWWELINYVRLICILSDTRTRSRVQPSAAECRRMQPSAAECSVVVGLSRRVIVDIRYKEDT